MGRAAAHDVHAAPPADLRIAMAAVAEVDAVARQYVNGFEDVCGTLVPWLRRGLARGLDLPQAITEMQLRWLAQEPDGLIVRKVGRQLADEARQLAAIALEEWLETGQRGVRWFALDTCLRADGHARNPGTTADLIAASLFVLLTTTD
jgi:triphosphoribosyl-dephospho-CoA synthase